MIVTVTPNPGLDRTLTVPHIVFNEMVRATKSRLDWGGKGFNVSRALQALGAESIALGFVGGATGQMLERGLSGLGIATDFVHIAGETRTNTIITSADAGQHVRYIKVNEAGPTVQAEESAAFLNRVRERVRPGDLWVLSGSLPPGVPPDFYAQIIALVQEREARALLDSSGEPLRLGCAASPYLVKPNAIEAEEMTGREVRSRLLVFNDYAKLPGQTYPFAGLPDATDFFLRQGIELVALSLGADGLLLASKQRAVWARPPRVQAQNPVGAGDALLAGIAWALACPEQACPEQSRRSRREHGLPLEEMARWGVATGTAAAMREGVNVGTRAKVEALYEQVQISKSCP